MYNWCSSLLTWLVVALGMACSPFLQGHSAGWMAVLQAPRILRHDPAPNCSHTRRKGLRQCPPISLLTALFDSEESVLHSRYSALTPCSRRRSHLKPMLADKLGHWSLRHTRAPRLPARWTQHERPLHRNNEDTDFRCSRLPQTKVLASQDCLSTSSLPGAPPPPGALQPARCWRSASARCCASSERHVRVGPHWYHLHLLSASHSHLPRCSTYLPSTTQVPPLLLTPVLGLACHGSGASLHGDGITRIKSFREGSQSVGSRGSACSALSVRSHTAFEPAVQHQCSSQFGSRDELLHRASDQASCQLSVHIHIRGISPPLTALGFRAPTSAHEWIPSGDFRLPRVGVVGVPSLWTYADGLKCGSATFSRDIGMGKRGKRSGRRRRPRDTQRESMRPPKRFRGEAAG